MPVGAVRPKVLESVSARSGSRPDAMQTHVDAFETADWRGAIVTLAVTSAMYVGTLAIQPAMCASAAGLAAWVLLRGGVFVRVFVLAHDCMHNAFFPASRFNVAIGRILAAQALTPFETWRRGHLFHHKTSGNLDVVNIDIAHRSGDTILWTLRDWAKMPQGRRSWLRVVRDPIVFFLLVPAIVFFVLYRFPNNDRVADVAFVNLFRIAEIAVVQLMWLGGSFWWTECMAMWVGACVGMMLFHLQHGVNKGYRVPASEHDRKLASIAGSTFLQVPFWLKWATLGIEYHHIHHLNPKVPCYRLASCHDSAPPGTWDDVVQVPFGKAAVASLLNVMWNEDTRKYEPFPEWKQVQDWLLTH